MFHRLFSRNIFFEFFFFQKKKKRRFSNSFRRSDAEFFTKILPNRNRRKELDAIGASKNGWMDCARDGKGSLDHGAPGILGPWGNLGCPGYGTHGNLRGPMGTLWGPMGNLWGPCGDRWGSMGCLWAGPLGPIEELRIRGAANERDCKLEGLTSFQNLLEF